MTNNKTKSKSQWVTLFLCLFLGYTGAHRFYVGHRIRGIILLALFLLTVGPTIFQLIHAITLYDKHQIAFAKEEENRKKGLGVTACPMIGYLHISGCHLTCCSEIKSMTRIDFIKRYNSDTRNLIGNSPIKYLEYTIVIILCFLVIRDLCTIVMAIISSRRKEEETKSDR